MPWAELQFSRESVNDAARRYVRLLHDGSGEIDIDEYMAELQYCSRVINNFRTSHAYPLNIIQMNLRKASKRLDSQALIAQRIKRLWSISFKLRMRQKMKLTQMQDLGGCRAVLRSSQGVRTLFEHYLQVSRMNHVIASRDDYILTPRKSGYRGIHLVLRYNSNKAIGAKYNTLKVEMQLRSRYQHAWATAVETAGTFTGQELKSGIGSPDWLRFFALMGSAIALRERTPLVPDTPINRAQLIEELHHYAQALEVERRLEAYAATLRRIEDTASDAYWYLLNLDRETTRLVVTSYGLYDIEVAQQALADLERQSPADKPSDAVLVSVDSLASLPKAYPNYYADTRVFLVLLRQALSGRASRVFTGELAFPS